ncbi:MAG: permease-like cell division protein FtsX [Peptococcaceae bacterium]|nr:permease-like cell division protein FtsX [Peptococcaceae bacterium]
MKISSIGYVVRDGFRNVRRNKIMSLASISTVAISLFLLGCVWLFITNVNNLVSTVESELEINAYIEETVSREDAQALADNIGAFPGVEKVTFIPREEGILLLEGRFGNDADLAGTVGDNNPLPDMIQVRASDPELVPALAQKLENTSGVETVRYGQGTVERLLQTADWVEQAGVIGLVGISIAAVFLISTSIRITVFSRRDEIDIMRLVGATNWYIRWPFLIEGVFIGLIGALLACVLLYFGYRGIVGYVSEHLAFVPLLTDNLALLGMARGILIFGASLGLLGSFLSVIRYLRV